jgi:type IV pilus assembly protein PilN
MIKINLLPFRAARRKENIRRQISIYALSVVFSLAVMGYFYLDFNRQLAALEADKAEKKSELDSYAEASRKIEELKTKIKQIRSKLEVIRELEKNKSGPVRLLDEISMAVPREKLWLSSLEENKGILTLRGTAMDNDTVALFMTNLERQEHIISVDLKSTRLENLEKYKLNVSDFVLTCKIYSYKEKAKPEEEKKKKR